MNETFYKYLNLQVITPLVVLVGGNALMETVSPRQLVKPTIIQCDYSKFR